MLRNLCSYTHIIFYTIYNIFRPTYKFHAICKKSPSKFDTISNSLSHTVHFWYHLTSFLLTLQVLQHTYNFFVIVQVSYHIYFCFVILQVSCPIHLFLLHPHILIAHALNYRRTIPNPYFFASPLKILLQPPFVFYCNFPACCQTSLSFPNLLLTRA